MCFCFSSVKKCTGKGSNEPIPQAVLKKKGNEPGNSTHQQKFKNVANATKGQGKLGIIVLVVLRMEFGLYNDHGFCQSDLAMPHKLAYKRPTSRILGN